MTILFPIDLPEGIKIRSSKCNLIHNQTAFQSPFNKEQQTQSLNAGTTDLWKGIWTTVILSPAQIRTMRAWLTSLKGVKNTFHAFDADAKLPSTFSAGAELAGTTGDLAGNQNQLAGIGDFPGLGAVDGGSQTGTSINFKNFSASSTLLNAGDYFQINDQYYMCLETVTSNGSGQGTANFEPAIRTSPADGDLIKTINAVMIAKMQEPFDGWETDQLKNGVISFAFEESING